MGSLTRTAAGPLRAAPRAPEGARSPLLPTPDASRRGGFKARSEVSDAALEAQSLSVAAPDVPPSSQAGAPLSGEAPPATSPSVAPERARWKVPAPQPGATVTKPGAFSQPWRTGRNPEVSSGAQPPRGVAEGVTAPPQSRASSRAPSPAAVVPTVVRERWIERMIRAPLGADPAAVEPGEARGPSTTNLPMPRPASAVRATPPALAQAFARAPLVASPVEPSAVIVRERAIMHAEAARAASQLPAPSGEPSPPRAPARTEPGPARPLAERITPRALPPPSIAAASPPARAALPPPERGPQVSVSIGRVEVRARARPAPPSVVTGPRSHMIDPGIPFGESSSGSW
ncbi:MAG: hypothetical protein JWM10_353 [Myxococcaceae bacterium]|nr:hypothetical protein [Myxococcaceae bacterium]